MTTNITRKFTLALCTTAFAAMVALAGCSVQKVDSATAGNASASSQEASSPSAAASQDAAFTTVAADEAGTVSIPKAGITEAASFYNFQAEDGTTVQMVGIADEDGVPRLALNTCQSCNPSPKAYFVQEGDVLVCQNCGQKFSADRVGDASQGCNPTALETLTESSDAFLVTADELNFAASKFAKWQGPTA